MEATDDLTPLGIRFWNTEASIDQKWSRRCFSESIVALEASRFLSAWVPWPMSWKMVEEWSPGIVLGELKTRLMGD
jgi:hypothetical protein